MTTESKDPLVPEKAKGTGIGELVGQMLILAVPIFLQRASFVIMKVTDTALLGHAGTEFLEAASLSDLWTQSTGVFVGTGVTLTLQSQALGSGNKELVGIWLQVGIVVMVPIFFVVATCWCLTGPVLQAFGKDRDLVNNAWYYAVVLMLCIPARILFSNISTYFQAQKKTTPGMVCAVIVMTLNLLFGLPLVLGWPIPGWDGYGFKACPWITTVLQYFQLVIVGVVFMGILKMHTDCWPDWHVKSVMKNVTRARVFVFLRLYIPGALSIGSDFWRVAVIGIVADSLSDMNLAVFNSSYRICWIMLTFLGSLASAMSILLGQALGAGKADESQKIVAVGVSVCVVLVGALSLAVAMMPRVFGGLFSNDPAMLDLFYEARWAMAFFVLFMNLGTMMESIPRAAGRMQTVFYVGIIGSWIGQVPGVILCTTYWRNDLIGLYTGAALGYLLLTLLLSATIISFDWNEVAKEARQRSELKETKETMESSLQPLASEKSDKAT